MNTSNIQGKGWSIAVRADMSMKSVNLDLVNWRMKSAPKKLKELNNPTLGNKLRQAHVKGLYWFNL